MKLLLLSAVLIVCVYGVLSTSPMYCGGCNPEECAVEDCGACGSYKDECDCCDRCFKCPGEECNYFAGERCLEDKPCVPPDGMTISEAMMNGRNGVCSNSNDVDNSASNSDNSGSNSDESDE